MNQKSLFDPEVRAGRCHLNRRIGEEVKGG